MTYVTLEYGLVEKSFSDWGIALAGASCQHQNQTPSEYSFVIPGGAVGDAPIFPYEGKIIIRRGRISADGTPDSFEDGSGYTAFVGYRFRAVEDAQPESLGVRYTFQNAWYYLEITTYQQSTAHFTGTETPIMGTPLWTSDVTLFWRWLWVEAVISPPAAAYMSSMAITNGQQIHDILTFLLNSMTEMGMAEPFQIGTTGDPTDADATEGPQLPLPSYQVQELTCAAAIQKCLELSPDCTVFFDYATEPPTIHVKKKTALTPVTLAIANGVDHKSLNITQRPDLTALRVILYYRYLNSVNGTSYINYGFDKYPADGAFTNPPWTIPPTRGPAVVTQTIDLVGFTQTSVSAPLRVRACDPFSQTWWAYHAPDLMDTHNDPPQGLGYYRVVPGSFSVTQARISQPNDDAATGTGLDEYGTPGSHANITTLLTSYPNELLDTQIADWMGMRYGSPPSNHPVVGIVVTVVAVVSYKLQGYCDIARALVTLETITEKTLTARITLTNGITAIYTNITQSTPAEAQPEGLAEMLYTALLNQWDGEHVRVENQITQPVTLANTLNLSGGNAAWTSMAAQIQSIREDEGSGETSVTIGPAKQLSAADLRSVQYYNRHRFPRTPNPTQRQEAQL